MPWIARIRNDFGTTLVDNRFASLALRARGSVVASANWDPVQVPLLYTAGPGAVVAVQSETPCAASVVASELTLRAQNASAVNWFVFDDPPPPQPGWALIIRNPDQGGKVTFDSRHQYATVAAVRGGNTFGEWQGSISLPGGRDYAVAVLRAAETHNVTWVRIGDPQIPEYRYTDNMTRSVTTVSGNVVSFGMGAPSTGIIESVGRTDPGVTRTYEDMTAVVLDVTNY